MNRQLQEDLVRAYGTPLYVYQLRAVRRATAELRDALPSPVLLYYSLKANPHPLLVDAIAAAGAGLELTSLGELATARDSGVPADRLLYTGPAKSVAEMASAVHDGIGLFSVESRADHARLIAAAGTVVHRPDPIRYLVRLNAGDAPAAAGLRMTGGPSQFGLDASRLTAGDEILSATGAVRPVGFHLFSASNLADEDALLAELAANASTAAEVATRTGFDPRFVDIGGGFAAPFATPADAVRYPRLHEALTGILDSHLPGWRSGAPAVAVESGRRLVAAAGTLLTTVMDVKTAGSKTYVLCDAGVNVLGGMSGLGRLLPAAQAAGQDDPDTTAVLAGPLCTPLDVISRAARLRSPAPGRVLAVPNVGGYGLNASLVAFLGRPLPVEVVLDGDEVVDARRLVLTPAGVSPGDTGYDRGRLT